MHTPLGYAQLHGRIMASSSSCTVTTVYKKMERDGKTKAKYYPLMFVVTKSPSTINPINYEVNIITQIKYLKGHCKYFYSLGFIPEIKKFFVPKYTLLIPSHIRTALVAEKP